MEERKKLIVELDGNVSEYPYGSFSEVYQSLMREMAEQQKVISGISINGVRISPDYLDSMALDEVSAAVITTTTVDSLIIDTIKTAIEYLPKLQSACLSVAENIHAGRDGESFRLLNEMSDGLEWMEQVSHGLANVSSDEIVRRAFEAWHDRYVEQLLVLVSAMERRDIISIADICEYELIPLFAECEEIMTKA
ncbi:hypothetical protein [Effusibacillus pohliae]|uniref:hypothetical protein n=1 Tax=Effusibacillus pohliae TaxID=232270 RepID=UPI0003A6492B|nr:hypothetical protein [Effusibacillus pohliae]